MNFNTFFVPLSFPTPGTFRQGLVKQSKMPLFPEVGLADPIAKVANTKRMINFMVWYSLLRFNTTVNTFQGCEVFYNNKIRP